LCFFSFKTELDLPLVKFVRQTTLLPLNATAAIKRPFLSSDQ